MVGGQAGHSGSVGGALGSRQGVPGQRAVREKGDTVKAMAATFTGAVVCAVAGLTLPALLLLAAGCVIAVYTVTDE